jgi:hypothetical protein
VAMVHAYMDGCRPSLEEFVRWLDVPPEKAEELVYPFRRLHAHGVFAGRFAPRRDPALQYRTGDAHESWVAWAYIAGVAAGFVGQGQHIQRQETEQVA